MAFGANVISSWIRISIWNADPDPGDKFNADPCGSGSETLVTGVRCVIMCKFATGKAIPCCWALLINKFEDAYQLLMDAVLRKVNRYGRDD